MSERRPRDDGRLDRVGMTGIETLVRLPGAEGALHLPARVDAFVSLDDPSAKGIHMSRIVLAIEEAVSSRDLTPALLGDLLARMRNEQGGLSRSAELRFETSLPVARRSLVSGLVGRRIYPLGWVGTLDREGRVRIRLETRVSYSSTCPCSLALARELLLDRFRTRFGGADAIRFDDAIEWLGAEHGLLPVPHSQRSSAAVGIEVDPEAEPLSPLALIDRIEGALGTPVQAAVKRVDEQEFARRNGENPLFCEDAARSVSAVLAAEPCILAHHVRVEHQESLHPHDAVAQASSANWMGA
ncbi:MAG: GTP cyclohydrolase FolE2 [Myxococcota bacterium]